MSPPEDRPPRWDTAPPNQWAQTYYELRDGKLYLCHNDNKDQCYEEQEIALDAFLERNGTSTERPLRDIVAFVRKQRERT